MHTGQSRACYEEGMFFLKVLGALAGVCPASSKYAGIELKWARLNVLGGSVSVIKCGSLPTHTRHTHTCMADRIIPSAPAFSDRYKMGNLKKRSLTKVVDLALCGLSLNSSNPG